MSLERRVRQASKNQSHPPWEKRCREAQEQTGNPISVPRLPSSTGYLLQPSCRSSRALCSTALPEKQPLAFLCQGFLVCAHFLFEKQQITRHSGFASNIIFSHAHFQAAKQATA